MLRRIASALAGVVALLVVTWSPLSAQQGDGFKDLSAEWWQWALSIPAADNPLLDVTGDDCGIGQHGAVWFLAGAFSGGRAERSCSIPQGKTIYFPVVNSINFDAPNVCGQGADSIPVQVLRAWSAGFIDGISNPSATLDGRPIRNLHRTQTKVFSVALPWLNVFDAGCGGPGTVPRGLYSPAVDDGLYVKIENLEPGVHTLHFHAENAAAGFLVDVTYELTVVSSME